VAKEVMAIKYIKRAIHSATKFLESPLAGKHPELIQKCTKAAEAEEAEVAAETEATAQQEQTKRQAPEFEALGGGACTAAQSVAAEATAAEAPQLRKPY
jgi:hypothetical protein